MRHRGPDGEGEWLNEDRLLGLCHTRLAIVDLSQAAAQPMHSPCGTLTLVFNGEIYNWQDLRAELIKKNHRFRTNSDTEVILAGYREWGEALVSRLQGMFAFALYDANTSALFCVRDRIGKKPFVYAESREGFAFASEIPPLLALSSLGFTLDTRTDEEALVGMLLHNLRHIPDPATAYRGLRRLKAGHAMLVRQGRVEKTWRYWNPIEEVARVPRPISPAAIRERLEIAVERRRVADVPVGALLSGGVDSSAIVALAQGRSSEPLRTYALGMDAHDEDLRRARNMAARLGTSHKEFYFSPDRQWEIFQNLLRCHGEPIMLLPLIHTHELARAVRADGIKVLLAGHGADELFYGYTGHVQTARLSRWLDRSQWLGPLARIVPEALRARPLELLAAAPGERKAALYRRYARRTWPKVLEREGAAGLNVVAADEMAYWGMLCPSQAYIDESNFVGLMVENTHSVTVAADLPAMLAGVEMRAPFLDSDIVATALATAWQDKIPADGDARKLKHVLKLAVADLVPDDLLYAPKRGFGMGIQEKFVLMSPWREHAERVFALFPSDGLFDGRKVRALWKGANASGTGPWDLLAKLLAIGIWRETT